MSESSGRRAKPPLDGVRVLEVANFIAGPYCGMQMADLGADVVKIENPKGGDMVRVTAPFIEGISSNFIRLNRNKRSLTLDFKTEEGKGVFRELAARADVIIENLRPGAMARLGLDYTRLRERNRGLIYVAATGFGQTGPYAQLAGLDIIAQGMSGLMSITGTPDGDPVKIGVPITDLVCALYGALAAVAALHARARDGEGQLIDVSLLESGVSLAMWEAGRYFATGEVGKPVGTAHQASAPYQAIRSADGFFTAGATTPKNWHAFCDVLGLQAIEHEERFSENHLRNQHRVELMELIEKVTTTLPSAHWVERLQAVGVPCGYIQNYGQVFNDPHLIARGAFVDAPHPTLGPIKQLASAMHFSRTPTRMTAAGPLLGEHTEAVLREYGLAEPEIQKLLKSGTITTVSSP